MRRVNLRVAHQSGFLGIVSGQHERPPVLAGFVGHRQSPAYRAQFAGQRQLAGKFVVLELLLRQLPGSRQDAQRNRQVETPAFLGQVGGRQIDGDASRRKFVTRIEQRGTHAIFAFLHFRLRQADDGEARQTVGQMGFGHHRRRFHAGEGAAVEDGQGHLAGLLQVFFQCGDPRFQRFHHLAGF